MGQGNYYGIVYGVIDKELIVFGSPVNEKLMDELLECKIIDRVAHDEGYGIRATYESEKNYVGIFIAITDKLLSEWWGCGYIEVLEMTNVQEFANKNFRKELKKAQDFWNDKVKPILDRHKYTKKPECHFIKDYD